MNHDDLPRHRATVQLDDADLEQARMEARVEELEGAIVNMHCQCLPYAQETGEGICQRCEALAGERGDE